MKKNTFLSNLILVAILSLGFALRWYKINIPLADHHSWRQADTAAVARNFIKEGLDFLHPRIDNMTYLAKPDLLNKDRLFLVEPPIYQLIIYPFYRIFGVDVSIARIVSLSFSLAAIIFLYLLIKDLINEWVGLLAAFFMAVLPYSVYYSRVVLPEPMMLPTTTAMFFFFNRWLANQEKAYWILSLIFISWSLLVKTYPFFLVLPMGYLAFKKWGFGALKQKGLWLMVFLSIIPFVLWRYWVLKFPAGIPPYEWLFNQGGIRFRPAFFRWIFAERISQLILGYWGVALFVLGLIRKPDNREGWFSYLWLVSFFIYVVVFAAGNVTHDYYQIPFIPICSLFLAKGAYFLLTAKGERFFRPACYICLFGVIGFMLFFSWFQVRDFYNIQGGADLAGLAVDKLTDKNAVVLAGDTNDATLLYNTNRIGFSGGYASYFPNTQDGVKRAIDLGATIYVSTKFDENSGFGKYMLENFLLMDKTNQYAVFNLKSPKSLP